MSAGVSAGVSAGAAVDQGGHAAAIDRFIDALWIEDGLAPLTLAAYRRDLQAYAVWLQRPLASSGEVDLLAYMAERHAGTRATTAN